MSPSPTFESQLRNPVEFPAGVDYVYGWFMELCHTGRSYGQSGLALPLNSSEIWAWSQLNGVRLAPWELRLIRLLDVKWLNAFNKKSS